MTGTAPVAGRDHGLVDIAVIGARNAHLYYNEPNLTAIRIGPWKSHFQVRDGFFDYLKPAALVFNLRSDPFEQRDGWKSQEIAMKLGVAWGGIQYVLGAWFQSLQQFPPRQKSGSLNMSETAAQPK